MVSENQLLLDPDFFIAFAIQKSRFAVDIRIRQESPHNEMTRYRYDVILRTRPQIEVPVVKKETEKWDPSVSNLRQLRGRLMTEQPQCLCLTGAPNARLEVDNRIMSGVHNGESISDLKLLLDIDNLRELDPTQFHILAKELGYQIAITWSAWSLEGDLDIIYTKNGTPELLDTYSSDQVLFRSLHNYANIPRRKENLDKLIYDVKQHLINKLPSYMIPSGFVVLNKFPLNRNGKIDRTQLPLPEYRASEDSYIAPRNSTESVLSSLVTEILGIDQVSMTDNFFDLGGDSLLSIQLVSQIHRSFQIDISLSDLYSAQTLADLATNIHVHSGFRTNIPARIKSEAENKEDVSFLILIQAGDLDAQPVICIPGAGANIGYFTHLAKVLGTHAPIYGLQPQGLDGERLPHQKVEEMADAYIISIEQLTAKGTIRLIGHSFGAWVALEMTNRLLVKGASVDTLILLDAPPPYESTQAFHHCTTTDALIQLGEIMGQSCNFPLNFDASDLAELSIDDQIALFRKKLIDVGLVASNTPLSSIQGMVAVFMANINAGYHPIPILHHPVVLLRAEDEGHNLLLQLMSNCEIRWRKFVSQLTVTRCPGNHMTMLCDPHVEIVAQHIKDIWYKR